MVEIKLIEKDTDLSNIEKMKWDAYFNDIPLHVYRLKEYYHSIGGKWGNNDYWCCNRNQKPTFDTLMEFSGNICNWGISVKEKNSHRYKWEEHEIDYYIKVEITRNNKVFYSFNVNDFDYGYSKARVILTSIHEHPICFNEIDFQNQIIGRKIMWDKMPCIIDSYTIGSDGIIITPDLNLISMNDWNNNLDDYFKDEGFVKEDLFSYSINWFRD